jgi:hypothetical protein
LRLANVFLENQKVFDLDLFGTWSIVNAVVSLELTATSDDEEPTSLIRVFLQKVSTCLQRDVKHIYAYRSHDDPNPATPRPGRNPVIGRLTAFCTRHPRAIPFELCDAVRLAKREKIFGLSSGSDQSFMQQYFPHHSEKKALAIFDVENAR